MGDMTRTDFVRKVLLMLGNIPTSHPVIAAGMHLDAINNAPNRLIRANPDLFPEHHNRSWTQGPTAIPGTIDLDGDELLGNRISVPRNLLILEKVTRNESDADPDAWASELEIPVPIVANAATVIGMLSKDSTATGYPYICGRKDSDIIYAPTTRAGWECYFRLYGVSRELPLDADDDVFEMDRDFDQVIALLAASETAEHIPGKEERAQELLGMAGTRLRERGGVVAMERAMRRTRVTIAGMPGGGW